MSVQSNNNPTLNKRTYWTVIAFYALIAFEFFYMASPFAVYFYSVYRPGLNLLASVPGIAWLSSFFLPHIVVKTASPLLNAHNIIGGILFAVGLLAFAVCAGQVYYHKLTRQAEVTGGLYRLVRHPQYAAFILSSLGMLLMWPRFLVLIMFVTMTFAYYFLARLEERECEQKFGQSYVDYKNRTGMFLPFNLPLAAKLPSLPQKGFARIIAILAVYTVTLALAILAGMGVKQIALNSLYAVYTPEAATVSVAEIDFAALEQVKEIALADAGVQAQLIAAGPDARFINYVVPAEWFISEIPMANASGHILPRNYDRTLYKVIFTQAQLPPGEETSAGQQILLNAVHKIGIVEVWVNLATGEITKIADTPETVKFDGVPVPVY